jgi:shikimate kinase
MMAGSPPSRVSLPVPARDRARQPGTCGLQGPYNAYNTMEPRKLPGQCTQILLTGFMGAGKSTVGRQLAGRLGWRFVDVDAWVEEQAGATIAELFAHHGEAHFRTLEVEAIRALSAKGHTVLALGGGALESEATRSLVGSLDSACIVFLDAPLDVLLERCRRQPGAAVRPLLKDMELLESRLARRLPHYRNAHLTIATTGLTAERVAAAIVEKLGKERLVAFEER